MIRTYTPLPCLRALLALAVLAGWIAPAVGQGEILPAGITPPPAKKTPEPASRDVQPGLEVPGTIRPVLTESEALVELRVLGARITYDEKDPARPVLKVNLYGTAIKDADLAHLESLTALRELRLLGCTRLTDAGLARVAGLKSLRVLDLGRTRVSDEGLKHLKGLTALEELDLSDTRVRGPGLVHLKGLTALRRLDLAGTDLSGGGLEHLAGLTRLEDVNLYFSNAGDAGLAHLKGLPRLRELNVRGTQVSQAAIFELRTALPRLDLVR
jgi:hypothetical protein